jgi:hypothetical protein
MWINKWGLATLPVWFNLKRVGLDQQRGFLVFFRGIEAGECIPDLMPFHPVIVENSVIDRITDPCARPDAETCSHRATQGWFTFTFIKARIVWEHVGVWSNPR